MTNPYAPVLPSGAQGPAVQPLATNAALLIDFDNVTMGMRSDLSKDLKKLLQSDVIRGKVTVQRAYADWRRYPQYIVPLSENSIDLIYAPAYGSSKKNATDIRMAIDGIELVFTRPEIGVFILLTGDSDFSSLVLKLKEYGKYVIGVGIQESSSDILVQNCDEYYSYNSLAGLQKTSETTQKPTDPWVLTGEAVKKMIARDDVMRSDRLKQVMIEIDPAFDEGDFGYSKFSRFLTEAASKGILQIRKMENGQYEVAAAGESGGSGSGARTSDGRRSGRGRDRSDGSEGRRGDGEGPRRDRSPDGASTKASARGDRGVKQADNPLQRGYELLRAALEKLEDRDEVRDSDVKRRMLHLDSSFDEGELGFGKFSRFLKQAQEDGEIVLAKSDYGNYLVSLPGDDSSASAPTRAPDRRGREPGATDRERDARDDRGDDRGGDAAATEDVVTVLEGSGSHSGEGSTTRRRLGPRRGTTRRRGDADGPVLFEGQAVAAESTAEGGDGEGDRPDSGESIDLAALGLPSEAESIKRYLSNSYKGVGVKTAEQLVEVLGAKTFHTLHSDEGRIQEILPSNRADALIESWREDFERRRRLASGEETDGNGSHPGRGSRRTRRGGRER